MRAMTDALLDGLIDYTSDERGDVGSWVRMACVRGLTRFVCTLFARAGALPDHAFAQYLPSDAFHDAIAGILKQGVERLDNVRQVAGECVCTLLTLELPEVDDPESWRVRGEDKMKALFLRCVANMWGYALPGTDLRP